MSSAAAVAPKRKHKRANLFEFCNVSGKTKITYCPSAPGSSIRGRSPGASFKYDGPEGSWTFNGSQITYEDTPLGQFISVILEPQAGAVPFTFWLFLPPVALADKDSRSFTTYGVKAENDSNVQTPDIAFEVERLFGDAKAVLLQP